MTETVMIGVLAAGLVLVTGGFIAFAIQRQHKAQVAREDLCRERGWSYAKGKGRVAFRVEGVHDGIPWELESRNRKSSSGSSGSNRQGIWSTPTEPRDGVVLIGPKLPGMILGLNLGGALAQMILQAVLGDEAKDLADVNEVPIGSGDFADKFSVLASSPQLAEETVTSDVREALIEIAQSSPFDSPPAIMRWKTRVDVRVADGLRTPERIEQMVELGVTIARRCGYA